MGKTIKELKMAFIIFGITAMVTGLFNPIVRGLVIPSINIQVINDLTSSMGVA